MFWLSEGDMLNWLFNVWIFVPARFTIKRMAANTENTPSLSCKLNIFAMLSCQICGPVHYDLSRGRAGCCLPSGVL